MNQILSITSERPLVVLEFPCEVAVYQTGFGGGLGPHVCSVPKPYVAITSAELCVRVFQALPQNLWHLMPEGWRSVKLN